MSSERRLLLAIRTIVVTTRVAVRSHLTAGNPDLARDSARRGAEMLAELGRNLPLAASDGIGQAYRDADRQLQEVMPPTGDPPTQV